MRVLVRFSGAVVLVCWFVLGGGAHAAAIDLLQCYELALQNDPAFLAARATADSGREALSLAHAQLLPNISINAARNRIVLDRTPSTVREPEEYFSSNVNLSVRQTLYRKPQFAQRAQAEAQVQATEADFDKAGQSLATRVAAAYFDVLYADDHHVLLIAQKDALEAQLAAAKRAFALGQGTRTDLDETEARLDLVQAQMLQARQQSQYARQQLANLIARPVEKLARLDGARIRLESPPLPLQDWVARAEADSPELRAQRARVQASEQEVEKARGGHYPTLDLVAQRSLSQSENIQFPETRYSSSQIGLQLVLPLYAGGYVDASVRQSLANLERDRQQYEQGRRTLGLQVRKEYQNVAEGIATVKALERALQSAQQRVHSTLKGIQAGTRTTLDWLDALQQQSRTGQDLALARYQYLLAELKLLELTGGLKLDDIKSRNKYFYDDAATANPITPVMEKPR